MHPWSKNIGPLPIRSYSHGSAGRQTIYKEDQWENYWPGCCLSGLYFSQWYCLQPFSVAHWRTRKFKNKWPTQEYKKESMGSPPRSSRPVVVCLCAWSSVSLRNRHICSTRRHKRIWRTNVLSFVFFSLGVCTVLSLCIVLCWYSGECIFFWENNLNMIPLGHCCALWWKWISSPGTIINNNIHITPSAWSGRRGWEDGGSCLGRIQVCHELALFSSTWFHFLGVRGIGAPRLVRRPSFRTGILNLKIGPFV